MAAGDAKIEYGSSAELTITTASLAESSDYTAGRESTRVDNTTNKYLDEILSGFITQTGTATAGEQIRIYLYGSLNDTPDYPDTITGTDSAVTLAAESRDAALKLCKVITMNATSGEVYYFSGISVASYFGGTLPKYWGIWITHAGDVALSGTEAECKFYHTPVYMTSAQA